MDPLIAGGQKRPVNRNLNESLAAEEAACRQQEKLRAQQMADARAADWDAVHEAVGSFADDHATL